MFVGIVVNMDIAKEKEFLYSCVNINKSTKFNNDYSSLVINGKCTTNIIKQYWHRFMCNYSFIYKQLSQLLVIQAILRDSKHVMVR